MSRILVALLMLINMISAAQELTLCGENFSRNEGKAVFMIYREQDDMPNTPFKTIKAEIKDGKTEAVVSIPYGEYAIILLHDKNENDKVDHSFGFPAEPLGYSNQWKFSLFSGMPSFDKLRFPFSEERVKEIVPIKYRK